MLAQTQTVPAREEFSQYYISGCPTIPLQFKSVNFIHGLDASLSQEIPTGRIRQGGMAEWTGTREQRETGLAEEVANVALERKGGGNTRTVTTLKTGAAVVFPVFSLQWLV